MPEPATPADDRCLAGLAAALAGLAVGPLDRILAGFAEALQVDAVALLDLDPPAVRTLAARERRPPPDGDLPLAPMTLAALADGRLVRGGPEIAAALARPSAEPTGSALLAPLPALAGPPAAALALVVNLTGWTWTSGQEHALRGLAGGLAGWLAARGLQQVVDALPQRIAWKDANLRWRGANRAFLRAAGVPAVTGRVGLDAGDEPARRREREVLDGGAPLQRLETAALPGGREQWSWVSRAPLEAGGLVTARDDITAPIALAGQLALAHRMAVIGRLAAGVGNDLRPLLADISADVAAARSDPAALDRIDLAAQTADDLVRQLAAFTRRLLAQPADVVPVQLLTRMEPTLARLLGERVELHLAAVGLRCVARVDPRLFEQLLALLARHVRDLLGGRGRVELDVSPDTIEPAAALSLALAPGEYVRVRLLASPGDAASATDPPPRPAGEQGLRRELVHAIAAHAGGAVQHATDDDGRTRIDVHLPRVFTVRSEPEARPVADVRGGETLLVVEDDPLVRPLLAAVLRHLDYQVLATGDVEEAARLAETGPSGQVSSTRIALALVSAALPGLRPADVLRRLRSAAPELRVLWIAPAAVAGPAGDPLVVPCSFEALAVRVRQALDARV